MARPSTPSIQEQFKSLTTRQTIDARTSGLRFGNRLMEKLAYCALEVVVDDHGNPTEKKEGEGGFKVVMSNSQIRAAEVVLKKILPDQAAIQEIKTDDFSDLGRAEMLELLGGIVAESPQLASNPIIQEAVNKAQTVVTLVTPSEAVVSIDTKKPIE